MLSYKRQPGAGLEDHLSTAADGMHTYSGARVAADAPSEHISSDAALQ